MRRWERGHLCPRCVFEKQEAGARRFAGRDARAPRNGLRVAPAQSREGGFGWSRKNTAAPFETLRRLLNRPSRNISYSLMLRSRGFVAGRPRRGRPATPAFAQARARMRVRPLFAIAQRGASQKRDGACRQFWSRAGVPPADGEAAGSSSTGILPVDGAKRRPHASPDAGGTPALRSDAGGTPALRSDMGGTPMLRSDAGVPPAPLLGGLAWPVFEMRPHATYAGRRA
jgi:hypothetical protein